MQVEVELCSPTRMCLGYSTLFNFVFSSNPTCLGFHSKLEDLYSIFLDVRDLNGLFY